MLLPLHWRKVRSGLRLTPRLRSVSPPSPSPTLLWGWQTSTALEGCAVADVVLAARRRACADALGAWHRARADAPAPRGCTRVGAGASVHRGHTHVGAGVAYAAGVRAGHGRRSVVVDVVVATAAGRVVAGRVLLTSVVRLVVRLVLRLVRLVVLVPVRATLVSLLSASE